MNLKKNDKIILIAGVLILIIAGVGIYFYTSPITEESIGEIISPVDYTYTWSQRTGEKIFGESLMADKNTPYEGSAFIQEASGIVITNVEFQLNWEDDVTYGLLFKKGLDTLTADITYENEIKSETSTGNGNYSFVFNINKRPDDGILEAMSLEDAKDMIESEFSGQNSVSFDVKVQVDTGERMIRLLKYLKDKGNDFELSATYTYYTYTLLESEHPENNTDDETTTTTGQDDFNHNVGEFYIHLGYGRGMI
jgi:hypothetical protein